MSARDELADILMSDAVMKADGFGRDYALAEADAILAAGYRKMELGEAAASFVDAELRSKGWIKPRTITTAEELDALGRGSTIVEPDGCVWVNDGQSEDPWASFGEDPFGGPIWTESSRITLPVTVIRETP